MKMMMMMMKIMTMMKIMKMKKMKKMKLMEKRMRMKMRIILMIMTGMIIVLFAEKRGGDGDQESDKECPRNRRDAGCIWWSWRSPSFTAIFSISMFTGCPKKFV